MPEKIGIVMAVMIWLPVEKEDDREALAKAGAVEELFDLFDGFLKNKGYLASGGQIIDATIVSAPKKHNSREYNETIK
jgi:IS5 family transposase